MKAFVWRAGTVKIPNVDTPPKIYTLRAEVCGSFALHPTIDFYGRLSEHLLSLTSRTSGLAVRVELALPTFFSRRSLKAFRKYLQPRARMAVSRLRAIRTTLQKASNVTPIGRKAGR